MTDSWFKRRVRLLFGIDIRALAAVRIGVGLLLLADLILRGFQLSVYYTDAGVLPRKFLGGSGLSTFSLHSLSGSTVFVSAIFVVGGIFAIMLMIGYRTRLATIVSWVLYLSLLRRNPFVVNGGDHLLCLLMFWGIFLPWGACASIDRLRGRVGPQTVTSVCSLATGAILIQVVLIYFMAGLSKHSQSWQSGLALFWILSNRNMSSGLGYALLDYPGLVMVLNYSTIYCERLSPLFAFAPIATPWFRTVFVCVFIGFHLGVVVFMALGIFHCIFIVALLLFVPSFFWDRWSRLGLSRWLEKKWSRWRISGEAPVVRRKRRKAWDLLPNMMIATALGYVILINLAYLPPPFVVPDWLRRCQRLPRFNQYWHLMERVPTGFYWFVVLAQVENGNEVYLIGGPAQTAYTDHRSSLAKMGIRGRAYLAGSRSRRDRGLLVQYANWLRDDWNENHDRAERIQSMKFYAVFRATQGPGRPSVVLDPILLYELYGSGRERYLDIDEYKAEWTRQLKAKNVVLTDFQHP